MTSRKSCHKLLAISCRLALSFFVVSSVPVYAGHGEETVETIAPERVKFLLDNKEKIFFVDLRSPKEFQQKHLPGARSIPIAELEKRIAEIPRTGRVILYCARRPGDDSYAYFLLRDKGYTNLAVIDDGFDGWIRRRFPVEIGRR
jgi:rhodanese-related sulfurtransferase